MTEARDQRNLSHSQFRDNTLIHQGSGDVNIHHYPRQSVRTEAIRIIPYPRNEDMVDRQDLVSSLDELLQQPKAASPCSAALWGLGGSGKTQIALDFAYRQCDDSECSVFWVHADTEATFLADYKTIGQKLGVEETLDGVDLLNAVRQRIEERPPWVIIFDNADDLRLFKRTDGSLFDHIPRLSCGMILWTSRDKNIAGTLVSPQRGIEVRAMTTDQATLLLERTGNIPSTAEEEALAGLMEELQRLPLAISQAGAYIRRTSTTVEEYLELLKRGKSRLEVLKRSDFDRHRRPTVTNSVLETFSISIERIREESEISYGILHVIAYVSTQDISYELIKAAVREIGNTDEATEKNGEHITDMEIQQAASRLQEFSFLGMLRKENGDRSYDMHKLVQEAVRYGLRERRRIESGPGPQREVEGEQSQAEAYYARVALHMVKGIFPISKPTSWRRCEQYLPHAIEVSKWAEASGAEIDTAALLVRASRFLLDRGRWWEKEAVDRRTSEIRQRVLGAEHPDTLVSMGNLALTYREQGRLKEAETLALQVTEIQQRVLGAEHPDTLFIMQNLASTYRKQGRWKEAEILGMQVTEIQQRVLGAEHLSTLTSIGNLASIYRKQGRWKEAEMLGMQLMETSQRVLGAEHPDTLIYMGHLASTYKNQRRWVEAETLEVQVMETSQRVLGAEHPDTLASIGNLASIYWSQGRWNEAEALEMQVTEIQQRVLGAEHLDTLTSLQNLASTYWDQGRWKEAETLEVQVMETRQRMLGAEHPHTLISMANLAAMYHSQARYDEAVTLCEATLHLRQRILGDAHPDTAQSMKHLAETQECLRQKQGSLVRTSPAAPAEKGNPRRNILRGFSKVKAKLLITRKSG